MIMKQVAVLIGAGSIGQAIVRRVAAGKHVVLADYSEQNAATAAKTLEDAGFECSTLRVDLGSEPHQRGRSLSFTGIGGRDSAC